MPQTVLIAVLLVFLATKPKTEFSLHGKQSKNFCYIPQNTGFLISKAEVTNAEYRQFLNHLVSINDLEKLSEAHVDSMRWKDELSYGEPYLNYYFQHPAYNDYPVVNISKHGAELYCRWLTDSYNATANQKVTFRLPTEQEWMLAAQGGNPNAKYAWEGESLTYTKKGKWYGEPLCNARIKTVALKNDTLKTNPSADITAPAISYLPNAYGLFNMCGNVAEMVSDKPITKGGSWRSLPEKIDINTSENFDGKPSPTVGFRVVAVPVNVAM